MTNLAGAKRMRLMLVENHLQLRERMCALLAHEPQFEVVAILESGVEAVNEARYYEPDLIVMDMILPDADGLTLTQVLRKLLPTSQVVLLALPEQRQTALACGASDIVVKHDLATHLIPTLKQIHASRLSKGEEQNL